MPRPRIAVAGAGLIGRRHVALVRRSPDCELAGVVEKPIADTVEDGTRLAEAAAGTVAAGTLGRVVAVQGSALFDEPADSAAPWRREPGGGPILINMIHEVDSLRVPCGDIVAVEAVAANGTRGHPVEDTVAIALRFASGALGTFLLSDTATAPLSWELTSGEDRVYPRCPDADCYVVSGTRGSLRVPTMRLDTYPATPSWWEPLTTTVVQVEGEVERADPLARQLAHFCEVMRGAAPRVDGRDAVETLRVTLAVAEASRSGRPLEPA